MGDRPPISGRRPDSSGILYVMPQGGENQVCEHLLINYATEDWALAEWLTRKLTAEGYRVWCDRFMLLGGESYPREIDEAIKNRTFRMLSLLSRASLTKPNPLKERTLALNIARERGIDFVIPLNVDGLRPTELDWMSSDLTFIPFSHGWAAGLRQLLAKLRSIDTPRSLLWLKLLDLFYSLRALSILPESDVIVTNTFWLPILLWQATAKIYVHVGRFPKGQMRFYGRAARLQAPSRAVAEAIESEAPNLSSPRRRISYWMA